MHAQILYCGLCDDVLLQRLGSLKIWLCGGWSFCIILMNLIYVLVLDSYTSDIRSSDFANYVEPLAYAK